MNVERIALAQQRLAHSRQMLVRQMDGSNGKHTSSVPGDLDEERAASRHHVPGTSWWPVISRAARGWWRRHPLNTAVQIAQPALSRIAEDRPMKLIGIAVAIGAVAAIVRPWRLISFTALAAAALRPGDIAGIAASVLMPEPPSPRKEKS